MRHVSAISLCALLASFGCASAQDLEINNADEFVDFVNRVNINRNLYERQTVVLSADIDLSSYQIEPIGKEGYGFRGHFDGQGHTVSGVVISSQEQYTGLFGQMYWYGSIKNVVLDDTCSIKSTFTGSNVNSFAGGILGGFWGGKDEDFYIENCVNMASVTFSGNTGTGGYSLVKIGGIAGSLDSGNFNVHVVNCVNKGTISYGGTADYPSIGGIIGYFDSNASIAASSVSRCANYGTVKSGGAAVTLSIGGVVGEGKNNFVVEKSVNYGMIVSGGVAVTSSVLIGGVIGEGNSESGSNPVIIRNCENYGEVSESADAQYSEFGGIVGRCKSTASTCPCKVSNCVNNGKLVHNGTVSDSVRLGGITGNSWKYNEVENCMNFGNLVEEGNKGTSEHICIHGRYHRSQRGISS